MRWGIKLATRLHPLFREYWDCWTRGRLAEAADLERLLTQNAPTLMQTAKTSRVTASLGHGQQVEEFRSQMRNIYESMFPSESSRNTSLAQRMSSILGRHERC